MSITRLSLAPILASALALTAGCGGSSSSDTTTTRGARTAAATPVANAASGYSPTAGHLSAPAQYEAFGRAVNLRPGDLPGFAAAPKVAGHRHLARNRAFEGGSRYQRCISGGRKTEPLLKAVSDEFRSGEGLAAESAHSEVQIAPAIAVVQRELATVRRLFRDPAALRCLTHAFDSLGSQSQATRVGRGTVRVTVGGLRVAPLQISALTAGTDGSFGLTLRLGVTYFVSAGERHATVPATLYLDGLAAIVGRAEVSLTTTALGRPFPAELEARAFSLLLSRAVAARHTYPAVEH